MPVHYCSPTNNGGIERRRDAKWLYNATIFPEKALSLRTLICAYITVILIEVACGGSDSGLAPIATETPESSAPIGTEAPGTSATVATDAGYLFLDNLGSRDHVMDAPAVAPKNEKDVNQSVERDDT